MESALEPSPQSHMSAEAGFVRELVVLTVSTSLRVRKKRKIH